MKYKMTLPVVLVVLASAWPAHAESTDDPVREVKLTLTPATEPQPALKYNLLPPLIDQTAGDGLAAYMSAVETFEAAAKDPDLSEKVADSVDTLPEQMDWSATQALVDRLSSQMELVDKAARYKSCQWNLPFETQGLAMELPSSISLWRFSAKVIGNRMRLAVHQGRFEDAVRSSQTALAMAQHMAGGPTVIQSLVGESMARLVAQGIEELVGAPGSPNLYWALAELPDPLIATSRNLEVERCIVLATFPDLKEKASAKLSAAQWDALLRKVVSTLSAPDMLNNDSLALHVIRAYPLAKQYFRTQGYSAAQVDAMPVGKVILLYSLREFEQLRDESFKWWNVPFWQAWPHVQKIDARIEQAVASGRGAPFMMLVTSLSKYQARTAALDKQIAALRVIEAIRLYAAAHDGQLPASLADIEQVPVPLNPMTGEPFPYRLDGAVAVLEAPSPKGLPNRYDVRYILTIRK